MMNNVCILKDGPKAILSGGHAVFSFNVPSANDEVIDRLDLKVVTVPASGLWVESLKVDGVEVLKEGSAVFTKGDLASDLSLVISELIPHLHPGETVTLELTNASATAREVSVVLAGFPRSYKPVPSFRQSFKELAASFLDGFITTALNELARHRQNLEEELGFEEEDDHPHVPEHFKWEGGSEAQDTVFMGFQLFVQSPETSGWTPGSVLECGQAGELRATCNSRAMLIERLNFGGVAPGEGVEVKDIRVGMNTRVMTAESISLTSLSDLPVRISVLPEQVVKICVRNTTTRHVALTASAVGKWLITEGT